jgi:hypothetical protein
VPEPDELQTVGSHDRFTQARHEASENHQWLVVYYNQNAKCRSPLDAEELVCFVANYRFLDCRLQEPDGNWFRFAYAKYIEDPESFCILDPETGEVMANRTFAQSSMELWQWLEHFLMEHPEKRGCLDKVSGKVVAPPRPITVSDSSDEGYEEDTYEVGQVVRVMVEFGTGDEGKRKRAKVELKGKQKVGELYTKVSSLIGKASRLFKLAFMVTGKCIELTDHELTLSDVDCGNCLLHVLDV